MKLNTTINSRRVRGFWGAHASRVLVSTSRRDELFSAWSLALRPGLFPTRTKFVAAGRCNQHARRVRSPELAFTLIEILTASLAAALILLAIYGLFQRSVKMRDHATERAHEAQLRGRAERVIRNDLRNAFVSGTDTRMLATTFEGGKQNTNSRFPGYLRFTTTTGKDTATDAYGDVQEVEYSIADSANGGDSHAGTLTRFITRDLLSTTPTTPIAEPLLTRVSSVEVAFFDGQSWQESWQFGTNSPTLPQAYTRLFEPRRLGPNLFETRCKR